MEDKEKLEKIFISYLDDNDKKINIYAELLEITDKLITFKTKKNFLTIPVLRILKLKKNIGGQNE